jgi:hypothetical protein
LAKKDEVVMSPERRAMLRLITSAVVPVTRPAGFRKSGQTFHRRRGEAVQLIGFRMAGAGDREFGGDIALAFDSLCQLAGLPVLEKPKESECDGRGTRGDLNQFVPSAPWLWTVRVKGDNSAVTRSLQRCVAAAIKELDQIDGIRAFAEHRWFRRYVPAPWRASVLYLLGRWDEAAREIEALAAQFHDRQNACRAEWWLERLHLTGLRASEGKVWPQRECFHKKPERLFDSSWITPTVKQLAAGISQEHAFEQMPILGDALEEAGCSDQEVLQHCRSGGEHVQGCWVVELILQKGHG